LRHRGRTRKQKETITRNTNAFKNFGQWETMLADIDGRAEQNQNRGRHKDTWAARMGADVEGLCQKNGSKIQIWEVWGGREAYRRHCT